MPGRFLDLGQHPVELLLGADQRVDVLDRARYWCIAPPPHAPPWSGSHRWSRRPDADGNSSDCVAARGCRLETRGHPRDEHVWHWGEGHAEAPKCKAIGWPGCTFRSTSLPGWTDFRKLRMLMRECRDRSYGYQANAPEKPSNSTTLVPVEQMWRDRTRRAGRCGGVTGNAADASCESNQPRKQKLQSRFLRFS